MLPLLKDWAMMNRLRCTYSQLKAEPYGEMLVFEAFAAGEDDVARANRSEGRE